MSYVIYCTIASSVKLYAEAWGLKLRPAFRSYHYSTSQITRLNEAAMLQGLESQDTRIATAALFAIGGDTVPFPLEGTP
jgi:hypothetical protein